MTIVERVTEVFEDEKRTKSVRVRSWEISGTALPREKVVPVRLKMSRCPAVYMVCSHQGADVFLALPISVWEFLILKWRRSWPWRWF